MHGININDWQTIQTRNYVKRIKESVVVSKPTDWAITIDIFLLFVAFLLDRIFADSPNGISRCTWIVIFAVGVILTLVPILITSLRNTRLKKLQRILPPNETIVTAFDEEVCYKLMSAVSFIDNLQSLKESTEANSKINESLAKFYYSQVIYYLNKAIDILAKYQSSLSDVLVLRSDKASTKRLDINRVENVCDLIDAIYELLQEHINQEPELQTQHSVLRLTHEKYRNLKGSVECIKKDLLKRSGTCEMEL